MALALDQFITQQLGNALNRRRFPPQFGEVCGGITCDMVGDGEPGAANPPHPARECLFWCITVLPV